MTDSEESRHPEDVCIACDRPREESADDAKYVSRRSFTEVLGRKAKHPEVTITQDQAGKLLEETRARAEGWRAGSASLVALILASLALRSANGWMSSFTGWKLYVLTGLIAVALICAAISTWFALRAAKGPMSLDTRVRDFHRPYDAERLFQRVKGARRDLVRGQFLLWVGVGLFALAVFASWLIEPTGSGMQFR